MTDDKTKTRPEDPRQISLKEPYEVNWWCHKFHCTRSELEAAIKAVGHYAHAVEAYFKTHHPKKHATPG